MDIKRSIPSGKDKKGYLTEASKYIVDVEDIFHKKSLLLLLETDHGKCLSYEDKLIFIVDQTLLIPTIHSLKQYGSKLKKVVVDVGAIKFLTNGADIMRPGITSIDPKIVVDELIEIVEEQNGATLAVGKAMYTSEDMSKLESGKVIKNLHYLKDFWYTF
jgi:predicted RNA-binding protein (TIGR00451 family)